MSLWTYVLTGEETSPWDFDPDELDELLKDFVEHEPPAEQMDPFHTPVTMATLMQMVD